MSGVSWQIVSKVLGSLLNDPAKAQRVMAEVMKMKKLRVMAEVMKMKKLNLEIMVNA